MQGRKVSIYIEGMIAAVIADITIIKNSNGKYSLHDVMKELYQHYYKNNKGYDELIYRELLEKYAGVSFDNYFKNYIWGKGHLEKGLEMALSEVGCELSKDINGNLSLFKSDKTNSLQNQLFSKWTNIVL